MVENKEHPTAEYLQQMVERQCPHCANEPEPGRIEWPNNGPITDCGVCNGTAKIAALQGSAS